MVICKVLGHKYKARNHTKLPAGLTNLRGYWDSELIEALKVRTYVCDICVRCGLIIKGEVK